MILKLMALSGSEWVAYQGFGFVPEGRCYASPTANEEWDAIIDLSEQLAKDKSDPKRWMASTTQYN